MMFALPNEKYEFVKNTIDYATSNPHSHADTYPEIIKRFKQFIAKKEPDTCYFVVIRLVKEIPELALDLLLIAVNQIKRPEEKRICMKFRVDFICTLVKLIPDQSENIFTVLKENKEFLFDFHFIDDDLPHIMKLCEAFPIHYSLFFQIAFDTIHENDYLAPFDKFESFIKLAILIDQSFRYLYHFYSHKIYDLASQELREAITDHHSSPEKSFLTLLNQFDLEDNIRDEIYWLYQALQDLNKTYHRYRSASLNNAYQLCNEILAQHPNVENKQFLTDQMNQSLTQVNPVRNQQTQQARTLRANYY